MWRDRGFIKILPTLLLSLSLSACNIGMLGGPGKLNFRAAEVSLPGYPLLAPTSQITQNSAVISWTTHSDPLAFTGTFRLKYSRTADMADPVVIENANSPVTLTPLLPGTRYFVQVEGLNSGGSTPSEIKEFTTLQALPAVPVIVQISTTSTTATIEWAAGQGGGPTESYALLYAQGTNPLTATPMAVTLPGPIQLTGLTTGASYSFVIRATNASGTSSTTIQTFSPVASAPGAPVLGQVTSITPTSAVISWTQGTGGTPTSHQVMVSTSSNFVGAVPVQATSPHTVSNLSPATLYYFRVTALNSSGNAASSDGSFNTAPAAPGVPTISVTPSQNSASFTFAAGPGGPVTSFSLVISIQSNLSSPLSTPNPVTSPYVQNSLLPATTYFYRLTATNSTSSTQTQIQSFQTQAVPAGAPVLGAVTAITASGATLNWSPAQGFPAPASYQVRFGTNQNLSAVNPVSVTTTSRVLTGLAASTLYYYQVTAVSSTGSLASSSGSFTTNPNPPSAPSGITVSAITATGATVAFTGGTGATSHNLQYSTSSSFPTGATTTSINGVSSPVAISGLSANTPYFVRIIAVNSASTTPSSASSFTTLMNAPSAPTGVQAVCSLTSAQITFTAGAGATSHSVETSTSSSFAGSPLVTNNAQSPTAVSSLTTGTPYFFRVRATNNGGFNISSTVSCTPILQVPGAPSNVVVTATTITTATLTFTGGAGATTHEILHTWDSSFASDVVTVANASSGITISNLVPGSTNYLRVFAINSAGSTSSSQITLITPPRLPSAPALGTTLNITSNSASVVWSSGGTQSHTSFSNTLHPKMQQYCASCHATFFNTSPHASPDAGVAHDAMYFVNSTNQRKIDPAIPANSLLLKKINTGHGGCSPTCRSEITSAVNAWLTAGGMTTGVASSFKVRVATSSGGLASATPINNAASPQVVGGALSSGTSYSFQVEATNSAGNSLSQIGTFTTLGQGTTPTPAPIDFDADLRMGDRNYVQSVIVQNFGVSIPAEMVWEAPVQNIAPSELLGLKVFQESAFGGGCDIYASGVLSGFPVEFSRERCFDNMTAYDPPVTNPRRYGSIAPVCNKMVSNTTTRDFAFNKIFGSSTPGPINDTNLGRAYQLFFQEEDLPPATKDKLIELANTQGTLTDKWRVIILGLCVSPEWQSIESQ
ncbi:MAG: fibronectin type III domain-containing protein [Bdellovibrionales bacterium]|nr:fibronectin type III domain-containing protein [Bdellovibrionales bacterium]